MDTKMAQATINITMRLTWWALWLMRSAVIWRWLGLPLTDRTITHLARMCVRSARFDGLPALHVGEPPMPRP
jgi:hypothetical protein